MYTVKTRQTYLKVLGYYKGEITGKEDKATKEAYKALQKDYFVNKKDIDGIYGNDTEILLINAYRCRKLKYFNLEEFKCSCGGKYCTGYPAKLNNYLLRNIDKVREKFGPTTITSGLRCKKKNSLAGGVSNSKHLTGKAVDYHNKYTFSKSNRTKVKNYWRTLPNADYTYSEDDRPEFKYMSNTINSDVK